MFGYPAAFRNGNMFAGLFQHSMILRLSPEDRANLAVRAGARAFEPMPGRPMREYVVVPPAIVESVGEVQRWLAKDEIVVTFDPNVCIHSGVCVSGLPDVFDVSRKRWIRPELESAEVVAAQIERCPSGALQYVRKVRAG